MNLQSNGHAHTFSIVARDPDTGKIGVGGTSHWFAYATLVPYIEAEVGAIATQAECNLSYGLGGLQLLHRGLDAASVGKQLIAEDVDRDIRQLLVMDNSGQTFAFTGSKCVQHAGDFAEMNFAVAGNMLANDRVIPAMVDFYHASLLPFETKIIKTLQVGQQHGGDVRGKRSAGLLIAEGKMSGDYWKGRLYDLRIDDHTEPLQEIERLFYLADGYRHMNLGDKAYYELKNRDEALQYYKEAAALMPDNVEARFWHAKLLWDMGDTQSAREMMHEVVKAGGNWKDYWMRVVGEDFGP